jgi:hypothetical protein
VATGVQTKVRSTTRAVVRADAAATKARQSRTTTPLI